MGSGAPTSFGALLRSYRLAAGLTQDELAERAGLSPRGVSDLERGARQRPHPATVGQLAEALQLSEAERAMLGAARRRPPPVAAPAGVSTPRPPHAELPLPLTSFVGRQRELAELRQLLAATRLLTLTGAGGVGKTRLALQIAQDSANRVDVALVELAALADGERVAQAVTTALGIAEQPGRRPLDVLADAVRPWQLLLVLDNCEHLIGACAQLAAHLLRACPTLTILATSREPLGLAGETTWRVPSLRVPTREAELDARAAAQSEAVQLFLLRAASVLPGFDLTERNAALVAQLCRQLDGIPLALELAAARVAALSVEQIAERLDDALGLLTAGRRAAPARQQTLRATLDWSYGLLAEAERHLFDRLSVFAGGWTLEAAEAVCADQQIERATILDLLARLVDKSLVVCQRGEEGPVRYGLLETLRQYGQQRLVERGEAQQLRRQHAEFFLTLAERTEPALHGHGGLAARTLLDQESDNLRAALSWLLDQQDVDRAQRLAGALARFWFFGGHLAEASASLARALSMPGGGRPTRGRAKCLHGVAMMALAHGDLAPIEGASREAQLIWRRLGDRGEEGFALFTLGSAALYRGDSATAHDLLEQSLALSRAVGHGALEANCLKYLAELAYGEGDLAQAQRWAEAAQARAAEVGFSLALALARRMLGLVKMRQGDARTARALLEASLTVSGELGGRWWAAQTLVSLAEFALGQGDLDEARARLTEGLTTAKVLADRIGTARALELCAQLAVLQHEPAVAMRLVGAASTIRRAIPLPLAPIERAALDGCLVRATAALGTSAARAARTDGETLPAEQAISLALGVAEPRPTRTSTDVLTTREQEVAALVARGLTNSHIAERLIIGERTVQTHVGNILSKLGLSSRAQIATWITERQHVAARSPSSRTFLDRSAAGLR